MVWVQSGTFWTIYYWTVIINRYVDLLYGLWDSRVVTHDRRIYNKMYFKRVTFSYFTRIKRHQLCSYAVRRIQTDAYAKIVCFYTNDYKTKCFTQYGCTVGSRWSLWDWRPSCILTETYRRTVDRTDWPGHAIRLFKTD